MLLSPAQYSPPLAFGDIQGCREAYQRLLTKAAPSDAADLLDWVRHRPIAHFDHGMLMVHAGVLPQWDIATTLELADEFQRALRAPNWKETLASLYGNEPNQI